MAVGGGMMGLPGSARAATTIKGTHGNGFCNAAFFITHGRQLAKEDGLTLGFVAIPRRSPIRSLSSAPGKSTSACCPESHGAL